MPTLIELAERCEHATGPDRELDNDIEEALCGERSVCPDPFTSSLDAAMTLVPDGSGVLVEQQTDEWLVTLWSDAFTPVAESHAITEPLARTAAALRARASQQTTEG